MVVSVLIAGLLLFATQSVVCGLVGGSSAFAPVAPAAVPSKAPRDSDPSSVILKDDDFLRPQSCSAPAQVGGDLPRGPFHLRVAYRDVMRVHHRVASSQTIDCRCGGDIFAGGALHAQQGESAVRPTPTTCATRPSTIWVVFDCITLLGALAALRVIVWCWLIERKLSHAADSELPTPWQCCALGLTTVACLVRTLEAMGLADPESGGWLAHALLLPTYSVSACLLVALAVAHEWRLYQRLARCELLEEIAATAPRRDQLQSRVNPVARSIETEIARLPSGAEADRQQLMRQTKLEMHRRQSALPILLGRHESIEHGKMAKTSKGSAHADGTVRMQAAVEVATPERAPAGEGACKIVVASTLPLVSGNGSQRTTRCPCDCPRVLDAQVLAATLTACHQRLLAMHAGIDGGARDEPPPPPSKVALAEPMAAVDGAYVDEVAAALEATVKVTTVANRLSPRSEGSVGQLHVGQRFRAGAAGVCPL